MNPGISEEPIKGCISGKVHILSRVLNIYSVSEMSMTDNIFQLICSDTLEKTQNGVIKER